MDLITLIKDNKVTFDSYRAGFFYYNIGDPSTALDDDMGPIIIRDFYQFTVPTEDIGNATLLAEDKAITYMRWIRKAIDENTLIKIK